MEVQVVERFSLANSELATLAICSGQIYLHHCLQSTESTPESSGMSLQVWTLVTIVQSARCFCFTEFGTDWPNTAPPPPPTICGAVKTKLLCVRNPPSSHSKHKTQKPFSSNTLTPSPSSIIFLISLSGLLLIKTETSLAQRFLR